MMLTIHGLPPVATYQDVRTLLQRECNLSDFILDNLVTEKNGKTVRIGVADEMEGAHVIKCLDGFRCAGKVLWVVPVGKSRGQVPPNAQQPTFESYPAQGNQYGQNQMGPGPNTGPWNSGSGNSGHGPNQWAPNQPQNMAGFQQNYQQNVPYQQQQPVLQRPLNQRELMLQNSRESFQGPPGGIPQQNVNTQQPSRGALRSIETVDLPKAGSGRYQNYEQPKPITIKKDNFMGPESDAAAYQGSPTPWQNQGTQKPQGFGKPNQPYGDDKKYNQPKPGILKTPMPDRGRENYKEPRFSPRRDSSGGRRMSPGRNVSPGRRMPGDQRIPPGDHRMPTGDHRMQPGDHRMQPGEHRIPHGDHRMPPDDHRIPPGDQRMQRDRMSDRRMGPDDRMPIDDRRMPINDVRMGPSDRRLPIDDRMGPNDRRMPIDDRMGSNDRRMPPVTSPMDRRPPIDDRMGPNDRRMPPVTGPMDRKPPIDDRMGPMDRRPLIDDRMGPNDRRMLPVAGPIDRRAPIDDRMGPNDRRMPPVAGPIDRRAPIDDRMGPNDRKMPLKDDQLGPNELRMPHDRRMSPGRRISPSGRRISPSGRRDAMGRHISPSGRRVSPSGRRFSPGRRISPSDRRVSPTGRRISPSGRRISPSGRRDSPPGRRVSPSGRRMSPSDKRRSPDRRMLSPGRRSPNRRMSPDRPMRYSPGRHPDKDRLKQIRPAYEPGQKAANQALYSGGYRPNVQAPAQFPVVPGAERISPWQERGQEKFVKKEEDRRDRMVSRLSDHAEKRVSPRESRSPGPRDRSPLRDRYRSYSPSPRSPRRSWALEKRRSPEHDPPPPPVWPGQTQEEYQRPNRPDREKEKSKQPVWDTFGKDERDRAPDFPSDIRVRKDMGARDLGPSRREPSPHRYKQDDRFREPKFERNYPDRRFPDDRKKFPDRNEFIERSERAHEEYNKKEDMLPKHQGPRAEAYRNKHEQFEDEFQDIYQRAVDFAKKAQELRKRDDYKKEPEDHRRDDRERHGRDGREHFSRHEEERPRSRHSDEYKHKREPEWNIDPRKRLEPYVLEKRDKAVEEISRRISTKFIAKVEPEIKNKVVDEIKDRLFNLIYDMYGDKDVSYIELIIKFNKRFDARAEEKIFYEAASKCSVQYRGMKRPASGASEIPAKSARRTPESDVKGVAKPSGTIISDWKPNPVDFANQMAMQQLLMNPFVPTVVPTLPIVAPVPPVDQVYQPNRTYDETDGFHLYLCKDNFHAFRCDEVGDLKEFVVSEIFNTTATSHWSPSFVFKGLQTPARYELVTQDTNSRDWLLALDFRAFEKFNVLVYTSEELWYERVAIWLPGHSKCRYIDPLAKLQLQNRKVKGVDIGKWKFVKSIVTVKGTRLYADVPPSVARVLETKKTLSYELQQVNVFLKAVAVDKQAFDMGLAEPSLTDDKAIATAIQTSPMPTLKNELDMVKITVKGYKSLSVAIARKIKNMLVFELFKYLRNGGQSSTDFIKYGLCLPNCFAVVPANTESKKWLTQLNMGNLYRRRIIVLGGEEQVKRIPLRIYINNARTNSNMTYVFERLKQSNRGVKGLHFNLWKPLNLGHESDNLILKVLIDMESIEAIADLKFSLDYVDEHYDNEVRTVRVTSDAGEKRLIEIVKEYKMEQSDSYVVANMDIESSETDDDIVCLGETDHEKIDLSE